MPFRAEYGMSLHARVQLQIPDGWAFEGLADAPTDLKSAFGQASVCVTPDPHGAVGTLSIDSPPGFFPADKYADFCESRQTIADTWSMPLILRKASTK